MARTCICIRLLLIIVFSNFAQTKRNKGVLSSKNDFVYLDRFCFQSDTGTLEYSFKYPLFYPTQMLLLYYDTEDQWPKAYKQLSTCEERVELLTNHSENNQIIRLSPFSTELGRCKIYKDSLYEDWVVCMGTRVFRSARSRWWFLAVANCDPEESDDRRMYNNESIGVYAEYSIQMTNGLPTDMLKYQFSIDEWLIFPCDAVFLVLQMILIIISYILGVNLSSRRLYHNTYRMCFQSIVINTLGLGFLVVNFLIYAMDGLGLPVIKTTGQFVRALADMLFVYMCLVLARGLNVSKMRLTVLDKIFLFFMLIFFILSYLLMQIWEIKYFDPALVYAQSESVPGYLLACWRIIAWGFFMVAALTSRNESESKKSFFTWFSALLTPWFWAPPVFLMLANFALNNWIRAEVVNIVDNCVTFYGYIVFLWLSRPTNGNHNFPFHIRTTQVDIDVGFDPTTAYTQNNDRNENDGMNGLPMEMASRATNPSKLDVDKGIPARPQYS